LWAARALFGSGKGLPSAAAQARFLYTANILLARRQSLLTKWEIEP
jgi:hypothetical protein